MSFIDRLRFAAPTAREETKPLAKAPRRRSKRVPIEPTHQHVVLALGPLVTHLRRIAQAYGLNNDPKAEGLEMAADIVERGGPRILEPR